MPQRGLLIPGNIDVGGIVPVNNPDGSVSTVYTASFGTDNGEVLVPRVVNGRVVSNQEALAEYRRTGKHLGIFDNPDNADAYAESLHKSEERRVMPQDIFDKISKEKSGDIFDQIHASPKEPAKGYGDASGNYTREMSAAQIAGNQFLNALEGMGVDPSHPIVGTIKNFIKSGGDAVDRISKSPVTETFGTIGDVVLAPAKALGNILSSDTTDEQKAQGAGQFLMSTPVAAAELSAPGLLKKALPSATMAGNALNEIQSKVAGNPIRTTAVEDVVSRAKELKATGSTMPKVMSDTARLLDKPLATTLKGEPYIPYEQARDLQSSAGRLSVTEKLATNPQMQAQIGKLAQALKDANREVAEKIGMGDQFDAAMKEYRQAMQIRNAADMLKKHGVKIAMTAGGLGIAGEIIKKHFFD